MPPLMQRPNPITLAILSFGALALVAVAPLTAVADQSCSSPTVPSLLPQTPSASKAKPLSEKDVASGGDLHVEADKCVASADHKNATCTGNVVTRWGDRQFKADQVDVDSHKNVKGQGGVDYTDPIVHILGAGGDYSPTGGADFKSAQFQLLQRPARGTADTMT